jgi:hypothetical protein
MIVPATRKSASEIATISGFICSQFTMNTAAAKVGPARQSKFQFSLLQESGVRSQNSGSLTLDPWLSDLVSWQACHLEVLPVDVSPESRNHKINSQYAGTGRSSPDSYQYVVNSNDNQQE